MLKFYFNRYIAKPFIYAFEISKLMYPALICISFILLFVFAIVFLTLKALGVMISLIF